VTLALRQFKPLTFLRELRAWSLASERTAWQLAGMALAELVPERLEIVFLRPLAKEVWRGSSGGPSFEALCPGALASWRETQTTYLRWCRREGRPHLSKKLLRSLGRLMLTETGNSSESHGIVFSRLYLDQRLVEFICSIPWQVVCEPGRPRSLMREA